MASFAGIAGVGKSIERLLAARFADSEPVPGRQTKVVLCRTEDFERSNGVITTPCLSIFLHRVDPNKVMRPVMAAVGHVDGRGHIPLDLNYLLTAWAENAEHEHLILGQAIEALEANPILSGPLLHGGTVWSASEAVQITMDEISTEAVMRTFDSLPTDYRLSVAYIARTIRLTTRAAAPDPPVTTVVAGAKPISDEERVKGRQVTP